MAAYAGFMTHVICRLTAKNRDKLRNPTLGNRVQATFIPQQIPSPLRKFHTSDLPPMLPSVAVA